MNHTIALHLLLLFSSSLLCSQSIPPSIKQHTIIGVTEPLKNSIDQLPDSDKIWLNLHNDQGVFSQILIGFIEGATNQIDRNYDGPRFFGSNPVAFYSIVDSVRLAIQGRAPRTDLEVIPLGVYSSIIEKITLQISIDELQGQLDNPNIEILLEDKVVNIEHDLKNSSYLFELLQGGTFDNRFNLIIKEVGVLNLDNFEHDDNLLLAMDGNHLWVKTKDKKIIVSFIALDFLGRTLLQIKPNSNAFSLNIGNIKSGTVLLTKVVLENNQTLSRKIIRYK